MQQSSEITEVYVQSTDVSIIIPSDASPRACLHVLQAIEKQKFQAREIVIVDSSGAADAEWAYVMSELSEAISGRLKVHRVDSALPGKARNLGIKLATGEWVGFLDVNTLPEVDWLERSLWNVTALGAMGSWGSTVFKATTDFAALLRDGIYGADAKRTLPGSVLHRRAVEAVGHFIEWVRAAEDTEWMNRAVTLGIPIADGPQASVQYVGMARISPGDAVKKWHRNYLASHRLQHLHFQKVIAWLMLYAFFVTAAFNWNAIAAGWQTDSPLYIDHVTKIASLAPLWIYIGIRGAWLPHLRGVPWQRLLPLRFLRIASVCLLLDTVKGLVFLFGRRQGSQAYESLA